MFYIQKILYIYFFLFSIINLASANDIETYRFADVTNCFPKFEMQVTPKNSDKYFAVKYDCTYSNVQPGKCNWIVSSPNWNQEYEGGLFPAGGYVPTTFRPISSLPSDAGTLGMLSYDLCLYGVDTDKTKVRIGIVTVTVTGELLPNSNFKYYIVVSVTLNEGYNAQFIEIKSCDMLVLIIDQKPPTR